MGSEARRILESALALSEEERAALAVELLATLDGEADPGVEQAWVEEITRRAERAHAGQTAGINADAVHAEARRIIEDP
jgi:putative addiction module component (TIGR02574 family)